MPNILSSLRKYKEKIDYYVHLRGATLVAQPHTPRITAVGLRLSTVEYTLEVWGSIRLIKKQNRYCPRRNMSIGIGGLRNSKVEEVYVLSLESQHGRQSESRYKQKE